MVEAAVSKVVEQVWYSGEDSAIKDFSPEFCSALIKLEEGFEPQAGRVRDNELVTHVRNNTIYGIPKAYKELSDLILDITQVANGEAGWNFDLTDIQPLQLSRYGVGEQYGWHMDILPVSLNQSMRKLTFNVVLNEDYAGGDFQFSWGSPSAPYRKRVIDQPQLKKRGRICIFPSLVWHRVKPVTEGVRYSLTGWIVGPPFR